MSSPGPSSTSWSRGALATAIALPSIAVAAAGALLYAQYAKEKAQLASSGGVRKKAGTRKKKSAAGGSETSKATGSAAASSAASNAVAAESNPGLQDDFTSPQAFVYALHADVDLRQANRPNARLEQRIWRNIRRITSATVKDYPCEVRTEIAQWIVAYHANASPQMDGGGTFEFGGPAGSSTTKYHRVALDYDLAWELLLSAEEELRANPTAENEECLKGAELVMLDLAHKMRQSARILEFYAKVRSRNTAVDAKGHLDAQQFTEIEFFTLWMLSPLIGRWGDFCAWTSFTVSKGQSLDDFHLLATQRPDLIDWRQVYRMVAKAAVEGRVPKIVQEVEEESAAAASSSSEEETKFLWHEPQPDELDWSLHDIVGTVWDFKESRGSDSEAIGKYVTSRSPEGQWKVIAPGMVNFRKLGACCRIQSMISVAVPIVGPLLRQADGEMMFHASGAVNFRADAQENGATGQKEPRLLRLVEEYKNFRRVPDEEVQELLIKHRPAVVARAKLAAASVAAIASETEGASTSAASSDSAASVEAKSSDASSDPSTSVDAAPVTPFVDDADKPLTLDEYNPASPPQLWRGVYIFEQYSVDEQVELDAETGKPLGTRHVPAEEPFMHVAYHVILKMTKSDVQSSALGSIE